jgi:hypothetical protein
VDYLNSEGDAFVANGRFSKEACPFRSLKGIGGADNKLMQAHIKTDHHNPSGPDAAWSTATSFRSV